VPEAMGGYFELEIPRGQHPYPGARSFNSARSALQALLRARGTRRVFMPHFLCTVVPDAVRAIDVQVIGYALDESLELQSLPELLAGDALLYVDYFGLKGEYIRNTLAQRYRETLIVDNSQALFSRPLHAIPTLYSPRKFVGVPDGGWLLNGPDNVEQPPLGAFAGRTDALLGRLAAGPEAHYADFQNNEHALGMEGLKGMSALTERLLDGIDYARVRQQRQANYSLLHGALAPLNRFAPAFVQVEAPLCYPLLVEDTASAAKLRAALLERRIFVPLYWREVLENPHAPELERSITQRLLPLPIDQRYGPEQIGHLADIIHTVSRTT
jgi:hypothetical protein